MWFTDSRSIHRGRSVRSRWHATEATLRTPAQVSATSEVRRAGLLIPGTRVIRQRIASHAPRPQRFATVLISGRRVVLAPRCSEQHNSLCSVRKSLSVSTRSRVSSRMTLARATACMVRRPPVTEGKSRRTLRIRCSHSRTSDSRRNGSSHTRCALPPMTPATQCTCSSRLTPPTRMSANWNASLGRRYSGVEQLPM